MEAVKARAARKLSKPVDELVKYLLQRLANIAKGKLLKEYAVGFIAIAERSRAEASALKLAARKERIEASHRKRV